MKAPKAPPAPPPPAYAPSRADASIVGAAGLSGATKAPDSIATSAAGLATKAATSKRSLIGGAS